MEKPSLLPLLDARLPLSEEKVAEAARLAGIPLAQAWGVVRYYPRYRGLPQGRLLVDDPVARARGFARLLKGADGTHPPLGLEALSPIHVRVEGEKRYVEWEGRLIPFKEFRLPFALGHGDRLLPPEPILELDRYEALGGLVFLRRALKNLLAPEAILEAVEEAGLLGRGGAAFPAHIKMRAVARGEPPRYLVVNADESEPGNFKACPSSSSRTSWKTRPPPLPT
ncbi:hypothetical protein CSW14_07450 [Thermus scotoductus]|uniref:NADH-ubiquinone oxidoreductase 51kDa subunit FMN-binding domain-containing protein n=1 Tax=Thermus scotoductus TaxID=37636 RepID=A0A430VNE9_THESC|nr:hypothetical protein [Thermus scotoductus]RTI54297.1 hypothetical protein CSW14_07450 [Thermus scotoductus]